MRNPLKNTRSTAPELAMSPMARVLRRARPRAEALEQRFMFDGAAAVDAVDVATKPLAEATAAQSAAASSAGRTATDARALPTSVVAAQHQAQQQIQQFLRQPDALDQLVQNFGSDDSEANAAWMATARSVVEQIQAGELEPRVELRSGSELQGAKAAFAARGTDGLPTLYLNADWLTGDGQSLGGADSESLVRVLVEELGHYIDTLLNPGSDAAGDEGERFARMVTEGIDPRALSFLAEQDDRAVLTLDGAQIEVELAKYTFISAYRMVYDLNNNGTIEGNLGETAAFKEQSSHNFRVTSAGSAVVIDDGTAGAQFSGNDVSAITLNIEAQPLYGWISRPIKSGGIVRGFYFWTDPQFTTLALAQADGNQDGDGNASDNKGYLLVVDQTWFSDQIAARSTSVSISNAIDGVLGTISYSTIGSSSDRVDSALNSVVASNAAPVAVNDAADGSNGTTAALEAGYNVTTVNASGAATGVLANDTDSNSDSLSVTKVGTGSATLQAVAAGTNSTNGTQIVGKYGTLRMGANGSYSYSVDNTHPAVDALQTGSNLTETFSYSVSDAKGGSATATLTVRINGTNDAPVSNPDYGVAKESTTNAGSGFTYTGYSASGNVVTNDTDVDSGETKTISGSSIGGAYTGSFQVNAATTILSFSSSNGQSLGSVQDGLKVFVAVGSSTAPANNSDSYYALYSLSGGVYTQITESNLTKNPNGTYSLQLSKIPTHYASAGQNSGSRSPTAYSSIADAEAFFTANKFVLFENSTSWVENSSGGKSSTVAAGATTATTDITVTGSVTGTVAVGMTVSGANVAPNTTVSALTYDSTGTLTRITFDKALTGASTGSQLFTFLGASGVGVTLNGAHGTLTLDSVGGYTYTPTTDNPYLASGQSALEVFDYTMRDSQNVTSANKLYITVYGTGSTDPVLVADTGTAFESGVGRAGNNSLTNDNTIYAGVNATGSVLSNDTAGSGGVVASVALQDGSGVVAAGANRTGSYGTLNIAANGTYTYTVDQANLTVNGLLPGATLTETFLYKVTNTALGQAWSSLVITLNGTNDRPVAVSDTDATSLKEDVTVVATGNVLANDTDVDTADTRRVALIGSTAVTSGSTAASGGATAQGTYGNLVIGADGNYQYSLAVTLAQQTAVNALTEGQSVSDAFTYNILDANSASSATAATLTFNITGTNESPVNTAPASVAASNNTDFFFTGGSAISVTDADGNLSSIVLHVDNGTLSSTYSTGLTITGSGTGDVTISGSQSNINSYLAALKYTPASSFSGMDYLTIFSKDTSNAYDSDGIAINVPKNFTGPTVTEADLASGSNPTGAGETASVTLAAPAGQTFGSSNQTGTGTRGTWTLNSSNGTFAYTLTSAASVNAASSTDTVDVTTYDAFGTAITNKVTVTITDDAPTAVADTATIGSGSTATGNVQTNDPFGADGAKLTSPSRGVVGVATGSTTSSPVSGSVGSAVAGTYGTLTLSADGSYSYVANAGVTGNPTDSFVYTIEDGDGDKSTTTLTFTVSSTAAPALSVADITVNEGSSHAVFIVSGTATQLASLALATGVTNAATGSGTDYGTASGTGLEYWNGTAWTAYTTGTVALNANGKLLVRTPITVDQIADNNETFRLVATNASGSGATGIATITDDGSGSVFTNANPSGDTPATSSAAPDDDRALSIANITVNENSPYGVFVVSGAANQLAALSLLAGTSNSATGSGTDYGAATGTGIEYWNGTTWSSYTSGNVSLNGNGKLLVRIAITDDTVFDNSETFRLSAANTGGTSGTGTATITDDGTGTLFTNGNPTGDTPPTNGSGALDDDRPAFSINDVTANEAAGTMTFTVTKTGTTTQTATVQYGFTDGSAVATADYTGVAGTLTFLAGETTKTFTVTVANDSPKVYEGSETFNVTLSGATNATISDATGVGTIVDNGSGTGGTDDDRPAFSVNDVTVNEGAGTLTFTVTKTGSTTQASSVEVVFADGTALAASDYTASGTTLNFAAGETTKTVTVTIVNDTVNPVFEGSETFTVGLQNASGAMISDATGVGTIVDDGSAGGPDDDRPVFTINDINVNEAIGATTFTVTKTGATTQTATVQYAFSNGTALLTGDYTGTGGTLSFAAGETTKTIAVTIVNDNPKVYEGAETFNVTLSSASNATIGDATGLATIDDSGSGTGGTDDDRPAFSVNDVTVNEAAGNLTFTVTKTGSTTQSATVQYATSNGTATAGVGADYTSTTGTLTFAAGTTTQTITVPIANDSVFELSEAFGVTLSSATDATISDATGTGTIVDDGTGSGGSDNDQPIFSINDVSVNEAAGTMTFTVTKAGTTTQSATVQYATSNGTATSGAGNDYTASSNTLTFAAGDATQTFTVQILNDSTYEGSESFNVTLSSATRAGIGDGSGVGTITDDGSGNGGTDDDRPAFAVNDVSVNEGAGTMTFTVTKTGTTALSSSVQYSIADGTAAGSGADYTGTPGTLTFAAGDTTKTFTVAITDDLVFENSETLTVNLAGATAATISDSSGTGTIIDNDTPNFSVDDVTVNEGAGTLTFTVSRNGSTAQTASVDYAFTNGTATAVSDFSASAGTLNFAIGESSKTITVNIVNDTPKVYEGSESFTVTLSNASNASISDTTGIGTIVDDGTGAGGTDNDRPVFSVDDVTVDEGAGTLTFTVSKTGATAQSSSVQVAFSDGTAALLSDYTATAGTLTFAANVTTQTITVTIVNDTPRVFEGAETFNVTLSGAVNATIGDASGTGTIVDNGTGAGTPDDDRPAFSINDVTVNEAAGTMTFTVTKTGTTTQTATVQYGFTDGSAVATADYTGVAGTLTFLAGETTKAFTVTVANDSPKVYEGSETFNVTLSGATNATISDATGVGTIVDNGSGTGGTDDDRPAFSVNDVTVNEGAGTLTFTVTKTGTTTQASSVEVVFADGTALAASDYTASGTTLNFAAGETTKTVTVTIVNDTLNPVFEGSETFTVGLQNASGATISDATGVGTIVDDGSAGGPDDDRPVFAINDINVNEAIGATTFTVTKTGATTQTATVQYAFSNGTALLTGDYTGTGGTLSFAAGETTKTITVTIVNDNPKVYEGSETFNVTLSSATNATIGDATGLATIDDSGSGTGGTDDDRPAFSVNDVTVNEAAGNLTFTVTKTGSTAQSATVQYAFANGTALATTDYVATGGTLTFAAGESTKTVVVGIVNDTPAIFEGSETFTITLSSATNSTISDNAGTGTVSDDGSGGGATDDDRPQVSIGNASAREGSDSYLVFTVTLSNASAQAIGFTPALVASGSGVGHALIGSDTGASSALEYSTNGTTWLAASGGVSIAAGLTSIQIRTAVTNDNPAIYEGAETLTLTTGSITGQVRNVGAATGTGTLTDDGAGGGQDDRPTISVSPVTVSEGVDTHVIFTVSLSNASARPISFSPTLATTGSGIGHAVLGTDLSSTLDYSADGTTWISAASGVSVAAGATSVQVRSLVTNDSPAVYEGNETFTFATGAITGGASNASGVSATGTIRDDNAAQDDRPLVSVSNVAVREGSDTHAVFTVSLDRLSSFPIGFTPSLNATGSGATDAVLGTDTAVATALDVSTDNGSTWSPVTGAVSIAAGQAGLKLRIALVNDQLSESSETFALTTGALTGTVRNTAAASGTATLSDDDAPPTVSINDLSVNEAAGVASFTVTRAGATGSAVTVAYASANGTAQAGASSDYTAVTGTLNFAAGETTKSIAVSIRNDAIYEGAETFTVTLSGATGASITRASGTATVLDDGSGSGGSDDDRPTLSIAPVTVYEGGSTHAVFTVTLSGQSAQAIGFAPLLQSTGSGVGHATLATDTGAQSALEYSTDNGATWQSAASGVQIPALLTSVSVRTAIVNDTAFEGRETFVLSSGAITGTVLNTAAVIAIAEIFDDGSGGGVDDRTLSVNSVTVNENSPRAVFQVGANAGQSLTLSLAAGTVNPPASAGGADYGHATTPLQYWDPSAASGAGAWVDYAGAFTIPGAATSAVTLLVRTPVIDDSTLEIAEDFKLNVAYATGASRNATGTATIRDDGIGTIFKPDGTDDPAALRDDDRGPPDLVTPRDSGRSGTDDITYFHRPTFAIDNLPAFVTSVELLVDGLVVPAVYDPVADTLTATSSIADGPHQIRWRTTDTAGIPGTPSPALAIVVDTVNPVGTLITQANATQVSGSAEPNALTTVTIGDLPSRAANVSGTGWTYLLSQNEIAYLNANPSTTISVLAEDVAGNQSTVTTEFSKASLDPPYITEFIPGDGGLVANRRSEGTPVLNFVFNEAVEKGAGTIKVYRLSDNLLIANVNVASPDVTVVGERGNDVFVSLPTALIQNTQYYATIDSGSFRDLDNLPFAGQVLTGTSGWDFLVAPAMIVPEFVADDDVINDAEAKSTVVIEASLEAATNVVRDIRLADISIDLFKNDNDNDDSNNVRVPATPVSYDAVTGRFAFSVAPGAWVEDVYTYKLSITGAVGAATSVVGLTYEFDNLVVDLTPPSAARTINITTIDDDVGSRTGNLLISGITPPVTDDTAPLLRGTLSTVLTGDDRIVLYRTADGVTTRLTGFNGIRTSTLNWTYSDSGLVHGKTYTYLARIEDAAGNPSANSDAETIVVDTQPPAAPLPPPDLTAATDSGVSDADDLTNSLTPTFAIGGIPADASAVELLVDGRVVEATYDLATGTLRANSSLSEGTHEIRYRYRDAAGNLSDTSPKLDVLIDRTPPTIALSPSDGFLGFEETATISFVVSEAVVDLTLTDASSQGGQLSAFSGSAATYTATFTPAASSRANGVISVASGRFSDRAGNLNTDGADADNTVTLSIDTVVPPVDVNSFDVNEASSHVVWTVAGTPGFRSTLALSGSASGGGVDFGTSGSDSRVHLQVWDPGQGSAGAWVDYNATTPPRMPPSGALHVRTSLVADALQDGGETVVLTVHPVGGTVATGTATIRDTGTGLLQTGAVAPTGPVTDPDPTKLDDDRPPIAANDSADLASKGSVSVDIRSNDTRRTVQPLAVHTVNGAAFTSLASSTDPVYSAAAGYREVDLSFGTLFIKADGTSQYRHDGRAFSVAPIAGALGQLEVRDDAGTWRALTQPLQLTYDQLEAGVIRYVPAASELGNSVKRVAAITELNALNESFTYTMSEGAKLSNTATVSYRIGDPGVIHNTPVVEPPDRDVDGITTQVESTLASRARGTTGLENVTYTLKAGNVVADTSGSQMQVDPLLFGDLNSDGIADAEQNAVTTFAWINSVYFQQANADPKSLATVAPIVSLVAERDAQSFQRPNAQLQLRNIFSVPITARQDALLDDMFEFTPNWSPMGFTAEMRADEIAAGRTTYDSNVNRSGDQWHFTVDISRTGESVKTFVQFLKWIDQPTLDAYSAAGLPLIDLTGKPITQAGWYDFTRKAGETTDGVAIGSGAGGNILFLDYVITDNRFGDSDPTVGRVVDPGMSVFINFRDDNRPVTVTSPVVNEASPHAVFTVSGAPAQVLVLSLKGGTATPGGIDFGTASGPSLEVSLDGGLTWTPYTGGEVVLPESGSILVRTPVINDSVFDNGETFQLVATTTGGERSAGTATLRDDGTGSIFTARGVDDLAAQRDDDTPRPVVVPPPLPPARTPAPMPVVIVEPPAAPPPRPSFDSAVRATQVTPLNPITPAAIGEIYTSSSGFRTAVIDAPQPALVLFKGVSDQFVERNRPTSFSLPADTFAHTRAEAVVSLEARQSNGTPLPAWMQFNAQAGTFNAQPPAGFTGQVEITVVARDSEGREAAATFKLNVGQGAVQPAAPVDQPTPPQAPTPPPPGRSSLSEQLRAAWQPAKRGFSGWAISEPALGAEVEAEQAVVDLPVELTLSTDDALPAKTAPAGLLARLISH